MENGLATSVRSAVVFVFVAPLIVMTSPLPPTFFPYIVGKALYIRSLVEIAFGLWLVLAFWYPSHRIPRSWLISVFGAYVFVALLASLLGVSPQRSLWSTYERMQGWIDLAHWFAFTVVAVSVFRTFRDWRALLQFNLAISFLMSLLGLAQMNDIPVLGYLSSGSRLDITLGNATFVGAYMLVNILIAAAFLAYSLAGPGEQRPRVSRSVERRRRRARARSGGVAGLPQIWWRVFWIAVIVLDGTMLMRSGTRGAVIGLAMGLLAFALGYIVWGKLRRVRIASAALVGALAIVVVAFVAVHNAGWFRDMAESNVMLRRLANIGPNDPSTRGRLNSALIGFSGFLDRPVLGWGPENYTIAYDENLTAKVAAVSTESFDQAHNKIIEEMVTKGLLGVGAYMAVWLFMLWIVVRRIRQQEPALQLFTMLIGAAATAYFVQNLFLFDTPGTVGQFYLLVGFVVFVETAPAAAFDTVTPSASGVEAVPRYAERYRFLQTDTAKAGALIGGGVIILLALFFLILGPYYGARNVLFALGADPAQTRTWDDRIAYFDQSIKAAPELANYPRRFMFATLGANWNSLNDQEIQATLERADREGRRALESEPKEWRINLALANLYQTASRRDPSYLRRARDLLDQAIELAPERIELKQLQVRQFVLEGNTDGAMAVIDDYMASHAKYLTPDSKITEIFDSLRQEVQRVIEAAAGSTSTDKG